MKKIRKLKIYKKFRYQRWQHTSVPEIRLEGKWLDKLGFKIGKEVSVKQEKNKLVITLIDKREEKQ